MRPMLFLFLTLFSLAAFGQASVSIQQLEANKLNVWLNTAYGKELTFSPMSLARLKQLLDQRVNDWIQSQEV